MRANFVMNCSERDLRELAFSTRSRIFRLSFPDNAVDRHFLTGLYDDDRTDLDIVGIDLLYFSVFCFNICVIRTNIHEFGDRPAALADRIALEQLANLVEPHNSDALGVFAERHRANRRHRHQEVLIKYLPVHDALEGLAKNIVTDRQVRDQEEQKADDRIIIQR